MLNAELFAGCGGLALGMSRAGFEHALVADLDRDAVATVQYNKVLAVEHVVDWPIIQKDVREINWLNYRGRLAAISGGPPCQPFGIGGKKRGFDDSRDMWPEVIRAIREAKPDGFLFENVRNLAGPKFKPYLDWIVEHLRHPESLRSKDENHESHLCRLREFGKSPTYRVNWQVVNAADFGAAQIRFRVLIFGVHSRLRIDPEPLCASHSRDRLLWDQYVTGEYWRRHGIKVRLNPSTESDQRRVERLRKLTEPPKGLPWMTVRDALEGLGEPDGFRNHVHQYGARVYPGHTGSTLDLPAKALKAGDHGVPGGENMMVRDDGSVRYFTAREAARLVGLPDEYLFPRSWTETMRQLGNAVPAPLAQAGGGWLRRMIAREMKGPISASRKITLG